MSERAGGKGFGLVLLEAKIVGTLVIAPAYGGSGKASIERVTGVAPADEPAEALTRSPDDLFKDAAQQAFAPERYAQLAVSRLL